MSFLSFEMTELHQNIFDTVILEHPVGRSGLLGRSGLPGRSSNYCYKG